MEEIGSEKDDKNSRWSKKGREADKIARQQATEDENPNAIKELIKKGTYVLKYDGKGLHTSDATTGIYGPSTWFEFQIFNRSGDKVGYYHIHPTPYGDDPCVSGNLCLVNSVQSSSTAIKVGSAQDWNWLLDLLENPGGLSGVPAAHTHPYF